MNKRRTAHESRHVRLHYWLMDTVAWAALNPAARATLIEVMRRYNGSNNGRIPISVREIAKALHIGKGVAWRALIDLQQKGFIVPAIKSTFDWKTNGGKPTGRATRWRLTEHGCDDELATKDFARWSPSGSETGHSPAHQVDSTAGHSK